MSESWYYLKNTDPVGPLTLQELKKVLTTFSNSSELFVWCERFTDWKPVKEVNELTSQSIPPPPTNVRPINSAERSGHSRLKDKQAPSSRKRNLARLTGASVLVAVIAFTVQTEEPPIITPDQHEEDQVPKPQQAHSEPPDNAQAAPIAHPQAPVTSPTQEHVLVPRGSEKPSFDCTQAKTAAARLICADAELARLDSQLGLAFRKRKAQTSVPDQSKFVSEQLAWINDRKTRCDLVGKNTAAIEVLASSKPCMVSMIQARIAFLAPTKTTIAPAPARPDN